MASTSGPGSGQHRPSGFEVLAGVGLGAAIGAAIDHHRNAGAHTGVAIGLGLGFLAGMYLLIKAALGSNKD